MEILDGIVWWDADDWIDGGVGKPRRDLVDIIVGILFLTISYDYY